MTLLTSTASGADSGAAGASYGWLGDIVVSIMEAIGPIGVAVAVFAENLFPPIPSELILPLAGFTAASGAFSPWEATAWATLGSVVGALLLYGLGAWLGRRRLYLVADRLPLVDREDVERSERWFHRHGYTTVLVGRMVPVFRSLISIPAGIERMHLGLFILFTLIGSGLWNSLFVWGGYLLGEQWHLVADYADGFSTIVLVAVVVLVLLWIVRRILRNRRRSSGTGTADDRGAGPVDQR
ncbi:DedA family protein [Citricoccus sp. GCM10030269]|uniref:DedA family protein n=1 Tax=Citricoccus sp. GCM10030269 TaxID=3273388 RepID=UPI00361A572F